MAFNKNDIERGYINWLHNRIFGIGKSKTYHKLFGELYDVPFYAKNFLDENRVSDGRKLKYEFGSEFDIPDDCIYKYLNSDDCSFIEMMVGISLRCEHEIMTNGFEDRTHVWFTTMLTNIDLVDLTDDVITYADRNRIREVCERVIYKTYDYNGSNGALFVVDDPRDDMRDRDIWTQMNWFLTEMMIYEKE